jgi:hypothetical protein
LLQVPTPYIVLILLLHATLGGFENDNGIWTEFFVDGIVLVLELWTLCSFLDNFDVYWLFICDISKFWASFHLGFWWVVTKWTMLILP